MRTVLQRFLLCVIFSALPLFAYAAGVDIGFTGGTQDIFFSKEKLIVGEPVRIYARAQNFRDTDVAAQVVFYQGSNLIGEPQPISIRANGLSDEVYVDWVIPDGAFNIRAEVKAQNPRDENPGNDIALTALLTGEKPLPPPPPTPPPSPSGGSSGATLPSGGLTGLATSVGGTSSSKNTTSETKKEKTLSGKEGSQPPSIALAPPRAPTLAVKGAVLGEEDAAVRQLANPAPTAITNDLLRVTLDIKQRRWNTFAMSADVNRAGEIAYEWSFGDGKTARGKNVTHAFLFAGRYIVSVVAIDPGGERAQTKVTLDISFWNLDNWQLWILLLLLAGFVVLLLFATRREKEEHHPHERSAVEEGDLPPVLLAESGSAGEESPIKKKRKAPARKKKPSVSSPETLLPPEEEPPLSPE